MGSATPDLETYYWAQKGRYTELVMNERAHKGAHLPAVSIVDMREELQKGNKSVFSDALRDAVEETVKSGEQAIILLNRRGFSTFVMCRDCGESIQCPNCAVALVYHAKQAQLVCHYCGHTEPVPKVCPKCGSKRIRFSEPERKKQKRASGSSAKASVPCGWIRIRRQGNFPMKRSCALFAAASTMSF